MTDDSRGSPEEDEPTTSHLDDLDDGAGCTEIWEHLSKRHEERAEADAEE